MRKMSQGLFAIKHIIGGIACDLVFTFFLFDDDFGYGIGWRGHRGGSLVRTPNCEDGVLARIFGEVGDAVSLREIASRACGDSS
jgi:hypothetical protein